MKAKLSKDKGCRSVPGYPGKAAKGGNTPEAYQREARAHKPSSAGTKGASLSKKSKM